MDRRRWRLEGIDEQPVTDEACVPLTALGVEDPERGRPSRWPVAVVGDERFRALADDVAAQADPRPASQFQADAGRLVDRGRETAWAAAQPGRIEDQEQGLRAAGERGETVESIGDPARRVALRQSTAGQVEDEQVDRATGEERAGDRQALVKAGRGDDHEPFEADAAGDGFDRVEAAREVEPGDDGPGGLRLRGGPQRQRRPAAGAVAADRDTGRAREATRPQDRIERGEAGADDPLIGERRGRRRLDEWRLPRRRRKCQRPDDPRSCGTPSRLKAREGGVHISARGRHRTSRIEQMF